MPFIDNPEKKIIREKWNTPLLQHLHGQGIKFRYMGLPGVDLIDVKLWKTMIEEIIAFEPRDENGDGRGPIEKMRRNLKILAL
jgi:hypothetical protein